MRRFNFFEPAPFDSFSIRPGTVRRLSTFYPARGPSAMR